VKYLINVYNGDVTPFLYGAANVNSLYIIHVISAKATKVEGSSNPHFSPGPLLYVWRHYWNWTCCIQL